MYSLMNLTVFIVNLSTLCSYLCILHLKWCVYQFIIIGYERSTSWGEPERPPHRREERSQSILYYCCFFLYGTSVTRGP